ncbi:hypothetical protein [Gordonia sp. OPL2]|uniref:hypothetical protein n=1 Tax=Gordonia sp. OPL2 TaxID=2486274 RepID=UPI001655C8EC|nr:hypothetical protein [Gordonia sp. OPL2]
MRNPRPVATLSAAVLLALGGGAAITEASGEANAAPSSTPLCSITYPDPMHPTRAEFSMVNVESAGAGATTFAFHTVSDALVAYKQQASVTWANLDTGRTGGGWDSNAVAEIDRGRTTITLPTQQVGSGRITVVAAVSNTAANGWTSNLDCTAEYTAQ